MTEKDALAFRKDIQNDEKIFCLMEDQKAPATQKPPTKLRNPKLFKPFEMYVKMYGLPAYNEMDPTWFVAITYSFIFGAMFGDVGQGLVLFLGGLFLIRPRRWILQESSAVPVYFPSFSDLCTAVSLVLKMYSRPYG